MGFRGVDVEDTGDAAPKEAAWPRREARGLRDALHDVSWRRFAIVVAYLAALVGAGAVVARLVSTQVSAALVVIGLIVLVGLALRSRNRGGDPGLDPTAGIYASGGEWMGDAGGGGDGGGGGD